MKPNLSAFQEKNLRMYFTAQFISLIGTFLQTAIVSALAYKITGSSTLTAVVTGCALAPMFLFGLVGGVVADKVPSRHYILYVTQAIEMTLAFVLAYLTFTKSLVLSEMIICSIILGTSSAFDSAARQPMIRQMFRGKTPEQVAEYMHSVAPLNAGLSNAGQLAGAFFAGIIILLSKNNWAGFGWGYLINALSFIGAFWALYNLDLSHLEPKKNADHPWKMVKEGVNYVKNEPSLIFLTVLIFLVSFFTRSVSTVFPTVADKLYHFKPALGYLLSAFGGGALVASLLISVYPKSMTPRKSIITGIIISGILCICLGLVHNLWLGLAIALLIGFTWPLIFAKINTMIQIISSNAFAGRVLSIFLLTFYLGYSVGGVVMGSLADRFGISEAFVMYGLATLCTGLVILVFFRTSIPDPKTVTS